MTYLVQYFESIHWGQGHVIALRPARAILAPSPKAFHRTGFYCAVKNTGCVIGGPVVKSRNKHWAKSVSPFGPCSSRRVQNDAMHENNSSNRRRALRNLLALVLAF